MIKYILSLCMAVNIASPIVFAFVNIPYTHVRTIKYPSIPNVNIISSLTAGIPDDSILDAEDAAAIDAHDVSDAGMEGAAMERAVIMAEKFKRDHQRKEQNVTADKSSEVKQTTSNHHGTNDSDYLLEAEEDAAFDAHDLSDAGMEAASMERAVMMAEDMKKK